MSTESSLPQPEGGLSTTQRLLLIAVGLVVAFLIIGTFIQPTPSNSQFTFGFETQPFAVLAVLAFAGGLLSFISPCTLPVLTAYFA